MTQRTMLQTTIDDQVIEYTKMIDQDGTQYLLDEYNPWVLRPGNILFCVLGEEDPTPVKRTFVSTRCSCQKTWEDGFGESRKCINHPLHCSALISTVEDGPDQSYPLFWRVVGTVEP